MTACVHDTVAARARAVPDATALRCGPEDVSYAELDARANRVARLLRERGARPEAVVAVRLPRSVRLVVALLGVLRSGAAYLPLPPGDRDDRTARMVADAGAVAELTPAWFDEHGADGTGTAPPAWAEPSNLAYVIYTSGSTGRPKGVQVEHRQLAAYLDWAGAAYGDDAPLHTPVAYDLSVTALWVPLVRGGTVTLLPESAGVAAELPGVLDGGPGFVKVTPAHLPVLADAATPGQAWPARIVVGGDALSGEALRHWAREAPDTVVVNEYGPTETTVGCAAHTVTAGGAAPGAVPIGTPIAGSALHVLDADGRRADDGELYVGGPLVTRGYRGRPGATADVYLPDPYAPDPGARMYRTGDVVRHDADGALVYAGRADRQLKVRGFRVHPSEIENALCAHPGVAAAAVTAEQRARRTWLVAHVVPRGAPAPAAEEIGRHLSGLVPEHMVPNELRWLPELPVTAGGKVDHAALAGPPTDAPAGTAAQPRTPTETAVADAFAELLGHPAHDLHTGFITLAGDSVGAAQLMARLARAHDVHIPMDVWHTESTIAGLAALIDAYHRDGRDAVLASHRQPEPDDFGLDDEILAGLEIGESHASA